MQSLLDNMPNLLGKDAEIDPEQLKHYFDVIKNKYVKTYMDRRKDHLLPDPVEELQVAIEEISEREREIHGILNISSILMDKNQDYVDMFVKLNDQRDFYEQQLMKREQEAEILAGGMTEVENRNSHLEKVITEKEADLKSVQSLNDGYKSIIQGLKQAMAQEKSPDKHQNLIDNYADSIQEKERQINVKDSEIKRLQKQLESTQKALAEEEEKFGKHESESSKWQIQLHDMEQENSMLTNQLRGENDKVQSYQSELISARRMSKQLKKDLKQFQKASQPKKESPARPSLMDELFGDGDESSNNPANELGALEEEQQSNLNLNSSFISFTPQNKTPTALQLTPNRKANSSFFFTNDSALGSSETVTIFDLQPLVNELYESVKNSVGEHSLDVSKAKDPIKEYFVLLVQAVKLCSPYMDAICTIPTRQLYEKALKSNVPFHRWHVWVENQLTNAYVQGLYDNQIKKKANEAPKLSIFPF